MGSSPSLSARHGWPRRNALSPDSVKLGVAPGAPLWIGCSSANRALTGKLLRDGIVAVPEVSGAGCLALSPVRRVRAAQPSGCFPGSSPWLAVHGDARRNAKRCGNRKYLAAQIKSARISSGSRSRCTGSTGLAGSPRRPRIMEGPLVSDTTEILGGAPTAPEDAPAAAGATATTPKSRSRGGAGLSSLLMPELQRIAQTLAIPGAGRMRKSQLVEAIEARQGGSPRQETSAARQGSDQRVASAGADATRPLKQDAMETDTLFPARYRRQRAGWSRHCRMPAAPSAADDSRTAARLLRGERLGRPPERFSSAHQDPGQPDPGRPGPEAQPRRPGPRGPGPGRCSSRRTARDAAINDAAAQNGAAPAAADTAQTDTQRGDRRRRNGQPSRGRDQAPREQNGRDNAGRDDGSRDSRDSARPGQPRQRPGQPGPGGPRAERPGSRRPGPAAAITTAATRAAGTRAGTAGIRAATAASRWPRAAARRASSTAMTTAAGAAATGSGTGTGGATGRATRSR